MDVYYNVYYICGTGAPFLIGRVCFVLHYIYCVGVGVLYCFYSCILMC